MTPPYKTRTQMVMENLRGRILRGDRGEMIQLFVKVNMAEVFALLPELQLGDIVGARGPMFATRIGKVTPKPGLHLLPALGVTTAGSRATG